MINKLSLKRGRWHRLIHLRGNPPYKTFDKSSSMRKFNNEKKVKIWQQKIEWNLLHTNADDEQSTVNESNSYKRS